jgi:DNA-binding transcriptional MerR regulator
VRIGDLAARLGTTPNTIRRYERDGLIPAPRRLPNGQREYSERDLEQLRVLVGLTRLDVPLEQAAYLAGLSAEERYDSISPELRRAISRKRRELRRRMEDLGYLDSQLEHLLDPASHVEGHRRAGSHPEA